MKEACAWPTHDTRRDYVPCFVTIAALRASSLRTLTGSRHTFGSDMVRAGISLPALMQLMEVTPTSKPLCTMCRSLSARTSTFSTPAPQLSASIHLAEDLFVKQLASPRSSIRWLRPWHCMMEDLFPPRSVLPPHATTTSRCAQLPRLCRRHIPRGYSPRATTPRSARPRMDGQPACTELRLWPTTTCIGQNSSALRRHPSAELAWSSQVAELARLLRREDIPRAHHAGVCPGRSPQSRISSYSRNSSAATIWSATSSCCCATPACVSANASDLSYDCCLRSTGPNQWAIHVPLGKLKTERMVPVDAFVRDLVHRLRFFRSLDPLPADERLLAWTGTKESFLARLREYLHMVCYSVDLPTDIVPHQMRHTYGTGNGPCRRGILQP